MRLSAKAQYACVAMVELACSYGDKNPVHLKNIANSHGISQRFLVQILLQLKGAGLATSTRGATGGHLLAREARSLHCTTARVRPHIKGEDVATVTMDMDGATVLCLMSYASRVERVYREKPADMRPVWIMKADGSDPQIVEPLHYQIAMDGSRPSWTSTTKGGKQSPKTNP